MWYRFEKGNPIGIPRIEKYQISFYDMERGGSCFDEAFFKPDEVDMVIPYVETIEDAKDSDRCRVFVHFDDGDIYELKLEKIEKWRNRCHFYDD